MQRIFTGISWADRCENNLKPSDENAKNQSRVLKVGVEECEENGCTSLLDYTRHIRSSLSTLLNKPIT